VRYWLSFKKSPYIPLVRGSLPHCPSAISEVIQNLTNSIPKVLCLLIIFEVHLVRFPLERGQGGFFTKKTIKKGPIRGLSNFIE